MARIWDEWWLTALFAFFAVGILGWLLIAAQHWVPAPWANGTELAGLVLVAVKWIGLLVLLIGSALIDTARWLRNPTFSWDAVRNFGEVCILVALVTVPPYLAEQWYSINWWLALGVTVAVVLPVVWKPLRLKGPW